MSTSTIKSASSSVGGVAPSTTGPLGSTHSVVQHAVSTHDAVNPPDSPSSTLAHQPLPHFESVAEDTEERHQPPHPHHARARRKSSIRAPDSRSTSSSAHPKSEHVESTPSTQQEHPRARRKSSVRHPVLPHATAPVTSAPAETIPESPTPPTLVPFFSITTAPTTQQPGPAPYSAKARPAVPPPPLPPRFAALAAVKGLPTMSGVIPKSVLQQSKKDRSGQATMWEVADHPNTRDNVHDLRFRTRLRLPLVPMADYQAEKKRLGEDPLVYECPWRTYPRRPKNPPLMPSRLVHENFRVWSIDTKQVQQSPKPQRAFLNKMDNTFRGPYFYAPNIKGPVRKKSYPLCKTKQESADAAAAARRKTSRPEGPTKMADERGEAPTDDGTTTLTSTITKETQTDVED